jgi:hypothetical protein
VLGTAAPGSAPHSAGSRSSAAARHRQAVDLSVQADRAHGFETLRCAARRVVGQPVVAGAQGQRGQVAGGLRNLDRVARTLG